MKFVVALIVPFALTVLVAAQSSRDVEWTTLTSKKSDFSITIPSGFVVFKNSRKNETSVYSSAPGSSYSVVFKEVPDPIGRLREIRGAFPDETGVSHFAVGEFQIDIRQTDKGVHRTKIFLASKKDFYEVNLVSEAADNPEIASAIRSLTLNGKPMVKGGTTAKANSTVSHDSLVTSPIVKEALKHQQSQKVDIAEEADEVEATKEVFYSRPAIILENPLPRPPMFSARFPIEFLSVKVLLKSNGDIGKISVVVGTPGPYQEAVIQAARRIKFVPAEINGVPVDSIKRMEYSFITSSRTF